MPTYEAFLDEKLGKIRLGGCIIDEDNPSRYCKDCHKSFGKYIAIFEKIEKVFFFIGSFLDDNHFIDILLESGSYTLAYRHLLPLEKKSGSENAPIETKKILTEEEIIYLHGIINKLYICEWPRSKINKDILDGTQWSIEIKYQGRRVIKKLGSNKFPPYFPELKKAMSTLSGGEL
jgi:hypothetical protein